MRNSGFLWIIIVILLILDIYTFQAVRWVSAAAAPRTKLIIFTLYWIIAIAALLTLILLPYINFNDLPKGFRTYLFAIIVGLFFSKLVASLFFLVDDLRRGGTWLVNKTGLIKSGDQAKGEGITRSAFLSWLGLGIGSTLFGTFLYGFTNQYRYQLNKVPLAFDTLPSSFKGLKVIHISDIHSGSFMDKQAVLEGVRSIMDQKPDLILFTGDIVNDHAQEMDNYLDVFGELTAPLGVFSILGNHDYGEYALPKGLNSEERKAKINSNVQNIKTVYEKLGWTLLMNEHVELKRGEESIALIGVENWSAKGNFPKYGQLDKAYRGSEKYPFRILMSHDPSHWDAEVKPKFQDVDLMLSGHTHGMQFGVEIPGFKWSPVQYMYRQWAGLYNHGKQKLYINRGYGFIGYPGRVGILPEITLLELI